MAGNYPDVPSWRMPIDKDGSVGVTITGIVPTQVAGTVMVDLNREVEPGGAPVANQPVTFAVIFPEKRDLDGYRMHVTADGGAFNFSKVEVSTNSTNGVDGTWTQIATGYATPAGTYRDGITSATALGIKAVRWSGSANAGSARLYQMHLYGEPVPGENPHRLALWHPTLDQRITPAYFDWGDVPRSSSLDRTFRVKNLSPSQTANSVRVAMDTLSDGSPSVPAQHTLSTDAATFLAQVNIGNLAPEALSGVLTLRRVTPSNAQLGLWALRLFAEANSWS